MSKNTVLLIVYFFCVANFSYAQEELPVEIIEIKNLGILVNSPAMDYAPFISADGQTLFFVSNRNGSMQLEGQDIPSNDFWKVEKEGKNGNRFGLPRNLYMLNSKGNEGVLTMTADQSRVFFTACDRKDSYGSCDIYETRYVDGKWSKPDNMGPYINTSGYETQPSVSPDGSRLYFVSTRKGPNSDGQLSPENYDIWYSDYDYEKDIWSPAKNLSELNTDKMDMAPCIAADNKSFFFASEGHDDNEGESDFYYSRYNKVEQKWAEAVHLDEPLNTEGREQFICVAPSGDLIYFSSTRTDIDGASGQFDLYYAKVSKMFNFTNLVIGAYNTSDNFLVPAMVSMKGTVNGVPFEKTVQLRAGERYYYYFDDEETKPNPTNVDLVKVEITAKCPGYKTAKQTFEFNNDNRTNEYNEIKIDMIPHQKPIIPKK